MLTRFYRFWAPPGMNDCLKRLFVVQKISSRPEQVLDLIYYNIEDVEKGNKKSVSVAAVLTLPDKNTRSYKVVNVNATINNSFC